MTTISIIGYGHKLTATEPRIAIICLIIWGIMIVPSKAGEIVNLISKRSIYADYKYKLISKVPHVVLIGSISMKNATNFFDEYFHPDHGLLTRHCIIIKPSRPDKKMENMLQNPKYLSKVHYIEGNPHDKKTFNRARLDRATDVVIMSNNLSSDPSKEDANTILQAMVIKKYLKQHEYSRCLVKLQLLKPESIMHYELSLNKETKNDQIVCIENLKLSLLAKSCTTPGLISLISNLIKSCEDRPDPSKLPKGAEWAWLSEYWAGKSHEIYRVPIPKSTLDKGFNELSNYVFKNYQTILFAIEVVEHDKDSGPIILNPGSFNNKVLENSKANFRYYGYLIADSLEGAEQIFTISDEPGGMANADKYLNLGVMTSHEDYLRRQNSDRMIDDNYSHDYIDSHEETNKYDLEEEEENELDVENLEGDWVHFCHLTQNPVKLEDIKFSTMKDSKLAKDHIIICGIVENMRGFVIPLRALHLKNLAPIVIFYEEEPTQQLWSQLARFPLIYFVRGSALKDSDLDKVNLEEAKQVVILSPLLNTKIVSEGGYSNNSKFNDSDNPLNDNEESMLKEDTKDEDAMREKKEKEENLMDAQTIFKYNIIKRRHKDVRIITELYSHENLAYLGEPNIYTVMNEYGYDQTPIFAAGEVYSSSLMDALVCQACYNSALITVLRQLVIGETRKSFQKKNMLTFGLEFAKIKSSNLYHVKVPDHLVGSKFSKLYKEFALEKLMIPLGLYRKDTVIKEKRRTLGSLRQKDYTDNYVNISYVVTNPEPDTVLRETDHVFVLAHEDPEEVRIIDNEEIDDSSSEKEFQKRDQSSMLIQSNNININEQRKADAINFYTKKTKQEFEESYNALQNKLSEMITEIMAINKQLNKKSTHMIKQVIDDVLNTINTVANTEKEKLDQERKKQLGPDKD